MKQIVRPVFLAVLLVILAAAPCAVGSAENAPLPVVIWTAETEVGPVRVRSDKLDGEAWLFLPAYADLTALPLTAEGVEGEASWQAADGSSVAFENGAAVDWLALAEEPLETVYSASLVSAESNEPLFRLNVMKSAYLRSMYLFSDDPANEGRAWLEDCVAHERSTSARLYMLRADGSVSAAEAVENIRGRGNSTWEKTVDKKPYQIKLAKKLDLLESGDPKEANKKWALLSNEPVLTFDADLSMLRNQIALDLGKEFGISDTSRCEQVDLYYDECYRGTYLLCEKVEVNPGRIEVPDYDDLLERLAMEAGVALEELPLGSSTNRYGMSIYFPQGVPEPENIQAAGIVIELERGTLADGTFDDPAWFKMSNNQTFALENPSMGGERVVTFASELMEEAYRTFQNYGVDPDTGAEISALMDVPSFTQSFLMQEITQNKDAYSSGSTLFIVRPGERKLYAGPIWDFDLTTEQVGALRNKRWSVFFYRTTVFQKAAKEIYAGELYPLVRNILLGETAGQYLKPLSQYRRELEASWNMNYHRFIAKGMRDGANVDSLEPYITSLYTFYDKQSEWLLAEIASWSEDEPSDHADVVLDSPMGDIARYMTAAVTDEQRSSLHVSDLTLTCLREATLEANGLWQATITLDSKPGVRLSDALTVSVNGEGSEYVRLSEHAAQLTYVFENPLYRPAVYEGVDYGLVFHYDYFCETYPDLLAECGGTLEGALRYYVTEGMDEGLMCSEYFDPIGIPLNNWSLEAKYGDDWRAYIELFMADSRSGELERFVPERAGEGGR